MQKIITNVTTVEWLPHVSPNYYGWQLSIGNIPENSQIWLGDNRKAELYRLVSKTFDSNDQTYTVVFEQNGTQLPPLKCDSNTTLSVKMLSNLN